MVGFLFGAYGLVSYLVFVASILYAMGFVGDLSVPKTIDSGTPCGLAIVYNLGLLGMFAVQHSLMARPTFKRWWTRIVPPAIERSTYVLISSLTLTAVFMLWRPLTQPIWIVHGAAATALKVVYWMGWGVAFSAKFALGHFKMFGLGQIYDRVRSRPMAASEFQNPGLYRYVRHPQCLGYMMAFWATPSMTLGHLLFAAGTTAYILVALQLEERDLVTDFGDRYRAYRTQAGLLWPRVAFRRVPEGSFR